MGKITKNTQEGPKVEDLKYSLYIQKQLMHLEPYMFVEDMTHHYSVTLCKKFSNELFFDFDGDYEKFKAVFGYDFLRYELDKLLSRITKNLLFFGMAYVERVFWFDENDTIKRVTYHCINCFRIKNRCKNIIYSLKDSNGKKYKGKIDRDNVIVFKLKDIGFSKRFFLKKIKKLKKLEFPKAHLSSNKDFSWSVLNSKQDYHLLKIMKDVYWSARKNNNKYITEPYLIYRQMQYEKLANTFLGYLIEKINADIRSLSKKTKIVGDIKFESITECYDELLGDFNAGKKNCKEVGNIIFKGL